MNYIFNIFCIRFSLWVGGGGADISLKSLLNNYYYFSSKIVVDKLNVTRWCGYDVSSMNASIDECLAFSILKLEYIFLSEFRFDSSALIGPLRARVADMSVCIVKVWYNGIYSRHMQSNVSRISLVWMVFYILIFVHNKNNSI